MKEALFLILGWLLGLFGPWLTDLIQKPYRRAQIRNSLFIELRELRYKLAGVVFLLASNSGTLDRQKLEWAESVMLTDKAHYEDSAVVEALRSVLKSNDAQLQVLAHHAQGQWEALKLKKYFLPFLSSQITALHLFTPEFQRLTLEIHSKLAIVNEEVDAYRFYYEKTFDSSLSNNSRAAVLSNLRETSRHMEIACRKISNNIELVLQKQK